MTTLLRQLLLHGLDQTLDQVKAIGHLLRSWRPAISSLRIHTIAIPADDLYPRMFFQPFLEGIRGAIRQEISHDPLFQIHQDGSIAAVALAPCPFIDPYNCNRSRWRT